MITDFLNKPLTDELISRIAEQCTLKGMRENEISFIVSPEEQSSPLLRKGVVGGWKSYFTPELNDRFDNEVLTKLEGSGLEFDFEIHTWQKKIHIAETGRKKKTLANSKNACTHDEPKNISLF